jgi:hypothetical protein
MALKLQYPTSVEACSTLINTESPPHAEMVTYTFPSRDNMTKVAMPEVKVIWYDGGMLPPRPVELADGDMLGDEDGGVIFVGSKGKIMTGCYGTKPVLLPKSRMDNFQEPPALIPRIAGVGLDVWGGGHERDWIRACKESADSRVEASSNFGYAGPFNEMVVMGVLAVRLQNLKRVLHWDGEQMQFTNISDSDRIKIVTVDEFKITDGDPEFNRQFADYNAREIATEWIKHTYRNGWNLPPMP